MAGHPFLGDIASWAFALGADEVSTDGQSGKRALVLPGGTIQFYDSRTGGTQYEDLTDLLGNTISSVSADEYGEYPQIIGPDRDPEVWVMWADGNGGAGPRRLIYATDAGDVINGLRQSLSDLIASNNALNAQVQSSLGVISYDGDASSWPTRPAGDPRLFAWLGPSAPPAGDPYMLDGEVWINTEPELA